MIIDLDLRQPVAPSPSDNRMAGGVPSYLIGGSDELVGSGSLPPTNPLAESPKPIEFNDLLNDITLPLLKAEDETKPAKWEGPIELKPRHREMMRRVLEGATYIEIAEAMGISPQSVMLVCSSAIFKEELSKLDSQLNLNVIRRAEEMSNEAIDKLKVMMRRSRSEALQVSCAEKILGIAGYSKIEKKQVAVISGEDVIRELNRRRREAANVSATGDPRANSRESIAVESAEVVG